LWEAEKTNTAFDWQNVLVAEQPFWFATVLCLSTLLRLTDRAHDFLFPALYNLIRILLGVAGLAAFTGGLLIAREGYSGGSVPRDFVFTAAIWIVASATILGAAQIGIKSRDREERPQHE
jgi:hypothetical protein